ncbi:MAG: glycosyltransferase [Promicromonosporaceae bacterium]|nr:glycosyltransferase [Promicromonosporaceae bacterium]
MTTPLFSIVTPVYNPPIDVLEDMIASVVGQTFADWELVLVDDLSPDPRVRETLRAAAARDSRVVVVEREANGHIVAASNDGVERARGEFVVLVDHDDLLTPDALEMMAEVIKVHPEADYLYSDEDKVDDEGRFYDEFRKPDWSPERLRSHMYTGHLSVLRTALVREVGGFHEGFDGSQDHDLVLRVTEKARGVVHVPEVLYHWRVVPGSAAGDPDAKPYAWIAGRKAVDEHLRRTGVKGHADFGPHPGTYRVVRDPLPPELQVSVVIPTRGGDGIVWGERRCFVVEAVRSLLARGGHDNLEIVVVHDTVTPPAVLDELREIAGNRLLLVPYDKPFNYSEKCNVGVLASHGSVVLLLNDDVEVIGEDLVGKLVAPLFEPGVGMTGARLLFSDGTIQHAGVQVFGGHYRHAFRMHPEEDPGTFAALRVDREVSALTAACVALKRSTFDAVGGLSEQLPVNFNDVDLSLKIAAAGLSRVWIAEARAYHFESQTREPVVHAWETALVEQRWYMPEVDPYLP